MGRLAPLLTTQYAETWPKQSGAPHFWIPDTISGPTQPSVNLPIACIYSLFIAVLRT